MYALRVRLPASSRQAYNLAIPAPRRALHTEEPTPSAGVSTPPAAQPKTSDAPSNVSGNGADTNGRRKRRYVTTRPAISVDQPRKWNRPIQHGLIPAYDLALKFLQTDSSRLRAEAQDVKKQIEALDVEVEQLRKTSEAEPQNEEAERVFKEKDEELEKLRDRLEALEVHSEVNLPHVRWQVANAMVDMSKPVHRHILEQRWRKEGNLDLLMERIHQMNVVPDVIPVLHPSVDLHITAKNTPDQCRRTKKIESRVEPGIFLAPEQTLEPPKLYANVFHADTRLYTLLMVDPDVPDPENASFTTFLHWLKPNIPLSATNAGRLLDLDTHTEYIPPHPQRGTPYHRYVVLLLPQPPASGTGYSLNTAARAQPGSSTSRHLDIPAVSDVDRLHFDVREFIKQWGLNPAKGGGAYMWREVWDATVSNIYANVLGSSEPKYGRPPKPDRYAGVKQAKRYIL
ncbi:PEBP-like protein [Pluteus cervinus]|uniref:PEBP-like protein n=1 Tax=Pluteus cervinus TaxID=181527 RepID=A0ACD3BFG7_9AGAR|nr:PEBP-like protein [Pluteus cervinus]